MTLLFIGLTFYVTFNIKSNTDKMAICLTE